MTTSPERTIQEMDPASLLVDVNVRRDNQANADLIESVRALGVLQPVVAVRTASGEVRVRHGHRRTLAAVAAGRSLVPVFVAADERTDDTAQVERLLEQYAENTHRAGLSTAECVGITEQLSAFGVSPAQIAKRTRMPRAQVDAALKVAGSTLAKAAADRYAFLDLAQAAAVAEFADEPEVVKVLVAAAQTGQFAHAAQRARDDRAEAECFQALAAALREQGTTVIDTPEHRSPITELDHLLGADEKGLTETNHADCPGHAAYVRDEFRWVDDAGDEPHPEADDPSADEDDEGAGAAAPRSSRQKQSWVRRPVAVHVCTEPAAHGHRARYASSTERPKMAELSPAEQDAARAERRDVITSNKAWDSAQKVRRDFLATLATRKTPPKGTGAFLGAALTSTSLRYALERGYDLAATLLGVAGSTSIYSSNYAKLSTAVENTTDQRATVVALVVVLAGYEEATDRNSWRRVDPDTRRYLSFLAAHGYTLSPVERRACGMEPEPTEDQDAPAPTGDDAS